MPVPSIPSYSQMPNNLSELLKIHRDGYSKLSKGLTSLKQVTNLTKTRVKQITKTTKELSKVTKEVKKITDLLKGGNFKKVNPKLGNAIGFALSLASVGLSLLTVNQIGKLQATQLKIDGIVQRDLDISFTRIVTNTLTLRKLREEFNNFINNYKRDKDDLRADITGNIKNITDVRVLSENAKKQANDALYEARAADGKLKAQAAEIEAGFQQLVGDITNQNAELANRTEQAKKLGNDALYEVRAGRQKIEAVVAQNFASAQSIAKQALTEARVNNQKSEAIFGQQLNNLRRELNLQVSNIEAKTSQQVNQLFKNSQSIINNVVNQGRQTQKQTNLIQQQLTKIQSDFGLLRQQAQKPIDIDTRTKILITSSPEIRQLLSALNGLDSRVNRIDLVSIPALNNTVNSVNNKAQLLNQRVTKLESTNLDSLGSRMDTIELTINTNKADIDRIKIDVKDTQKLNKNQYDNLLQTIALIPPLIAKVPDNTVRRMPKPLTPPQIETATGKAICRSTGSGGCIGNTLNNTTNNINNNLNQNFNRFGDRLVDKINAGANAAELALLTKINDKLGPKVSGGISGFLRQFSKRFDNYLKVFDIYLKTFDSFLNRFGGFVEWLKLDRLLIAMTWVTTVHNALMLSSSLKDTLFSAVDNIISIFVKDIDGQPIDTGSYFSGKIDSFAATIFGVQNWKELKKTWKAYNRIYQATANVLNRVTSMFNSVYNIFDVVGNRISRIGNALRWFGTIADNAYSWMNENNKFGNPIIDSITNLNEAADSIEQVSSEVLSVKEDAEELKKDTETLKNEIKKLSEKETKKEQKERDRLRIPTVENDDVV